MCFESDGCRRTYLSQRDLQAHIDHRHRTGSNIGSGTVTVSSTNISNNINTMVSKSDTVTRSETVISSLSGVKASTNGSNTVTTCVPVEKTITSNPISLLGPSPRMVMNTMVPPNCATAPPNIFINNQKNSGLLPLPTQTSTCSSSSTSSSSTLLSTRPLPMGMLTRPMRTNNPTVIVGNNPGNTNSTGNFPQIQQFPNCPPPRLPPPPIGAPNIPPPPTFLTNSLSVPQLSSTHNANFSGASAVAALVAVVSAAMSAVQSKSAGGSGVAGSTNLSGTIQQSLTNNQLRPPNPLTASLITNALRAANPNWNSLVANLIMHLAVMLKILYNIYDFKNPLELS
ncbi:unnamed protein product [Heterobilharzia americana]|nr:unnamed protein product [Heterobilharzia americana]